MMEESSRREHATRTDTRSVMEGLKATSKKGGNGGYRIFPIAREKKWTALLKKSVGSIQDMACMGEGVCSDDRVVNQ